MSKMADEIVAENNALELADLKEKYAILITKHIDLTQLLKQYQSGSKFDWEGRRSMSVNDREELWDRIMGIANPAP